MENVDTDQIIPARFLKATSREGFGENLFRDWRYDKDGNPIKDFVLNDPTYSGCILVAGKNFGSGSSREHAAWAIAGRYLEDFAYRMPQKAWIYIAATAAVSAVSLLAVLWQTLRAARTNPAEALKKE